jgi:hypothetical protein
VFLFAGFFVLQALSCGYIAVFLSVAVGLFVLYYLLFMPRSQIVPFFKKLVVAAILAGLIITPFLVPYLQVKKEHKFARTLDSNIKKSANILSYATISWFNENVFYFRKSLDLRRTIRLTDFGTLRPEGKGLFPGILTILLVLAAFLLPPYATRISDGRGVGGISRIRKVEIGVNSVLIFLVVLAAVIVISRGLEFSIAGLSISLKHLTNPVYLIIFLLVAKLILNRFTLRNLDHGENASFIHKNFYLFLAIFTGILSLGPRIYYVITDFGPGPYMVLYNNIVFFKGIRVPARFGIIVMLALSVLAGYGAAKAMRMLKNKGKAIFSGFILALLVYEFICAPLPYTKISREPAEVYKWLASTKEQFAILEYPLYELQTNKYYMYRSIFHWKNLGNGSSGFNPPVFNRLRKVAHEMGPFPHQEFIQYVKTRVPVKYLILHLESFSDQEKDEILMNASRFPEDLKLVHTFEKDDYVYEVIY